MKFAPILTSLECLLELCQVAYLQIRLSASYAFTLPKFFNKHFNAKKLAKFDYYFLKVGRIMVIDHFANALLL